MIDLDFIEISRRLKALRLPPFDLVVGIARGGIPPALLIAHQFEREARFIMLNYRDDDNNPRHSEPVALSAPLRDIPGGATILLVDDVSVSGKTLNAAKSILSANEVITFTLKGKADFVLFPEIKECVNWPWKLNEK